MKALARLLLPLLALLIVPLGSMTLLATPAAAQGTPAPPADQPGLGTTLWNNLFGDADQTRTNYTQAKAELDALPCWACKVFNSFSRNAFSAGESFSSQHGGTLASMIVAFATLFSMFYIGSAFVAGDASDLLSRWKVFWRLMIAVAVGTAWITAGSGAFGNTWDLVYSPLIEIPIGVADAVPGPGGTDSCNGASYEHPASAPASADRALQAMYKVVCGGHKMASAGLAFGITLGGTSNGFVGSLINAIAGIAIMIIFIWIIVSFPLRFIDVLLRLTVVGIVTPILVVCAVFRPTRSYIQIAIRNVLYAGCLFAFTSIMFKLGSGFFDQAAEASIQAMGSWNIATMLTQAVGVVGAAIIFAAMLKMAPALASEFSQFNGSSGGVGDSATNFASSIATLPVKAGAAAIALKTGGVAAGKVGAAAGQAGADAGIAAARLGKGVKDDG